VSKPPEIQTSTSDEQLDACRGSEPRDKFLELRGTDQLTGVIMIFGGLEAYQFKRMQKLAVQVINSLQPAANLLKVVEVNNHI